MSASHFEKAVRGGFALHRLSAPSGVAKSDFNLYGQLCPSGSLHTPSSGARRATKVSAVARSRANGLCAPRRRGLPRDSEITYGGRLVLRSLGRQKWRPIFWCARQLACRPSQDYAGWAPALHRLWFRSRVYARERVPTVLWARCTGISPCVEHGRLGGERGKLGHCRDEWTS